MVRATRRSPQAGLKTRTILQIHDELLFEGPPEEMERATEIVTREMVGAAELDPPLDGGRGRRAELAGREVAERPSTASSRYSRMRAAWEAPDSKRRVA